MNSNGFEISLGSEMANLFADYFSSVLTNQNIDMYDCNIESKLNICSYHIPISIIYEQLAKLDLRKVLMRFPLTPEKLQPYIVSSCYLFLINHRILEIYRIIGNSHVTPIYRSGKPLIQSTTPAASGGRG